MAKIKFAVAIIAAAAGFSIFGMPLLAQHMAQRATQTPPPQPAAPAPEAEPERKQMQFYADEQYNVEGTDTIIMVGNVVLHHNGAVVVCDSAVRYSESRFDCFGRVLINQDSTYIYCRQATYDRDLNIARVFDRLIKIVSGSSVLYTYNFSFNTLDNVGRYWGGGTMLQDSNRMESERGWYHTDTKDIYAAGSVQMTDPDYKMISDSVRYNTAEQVAEFYTLTYIWNSDDDMLSATKGKYYNRTREYDFTADAFVMTETQELISDSLRYNSLTRDAVARRNVQLRDDEEQVLAFGDYGEWHGGPQEGLLTLDPSLVSFDREAPEDSVYMRADSMFLYSIPWDSEWGADSLASVSDSLSALDIVSETPGGLSEVVDASVSDSLNALPEVVATPDSLSAPDIIREIPETVALPDSLVTFTHPVDSLADATVFDSVSAPVIVVDSLPVPEVIAIPDSLAPLPQPDSIPPVTDSLVLATDSIPAEPEHDSLQRMVRAYHNVKFWRRDFQGVCDSMTGFTKDSTAHMYIDPVLWNEENQITAEVIDIFSRDKELYRAEYTGNPLMVSLVFGEQYNQLAGRRMESFFRDGEVVRHFVDGNAQTHYYRVEEGDVEPNSFGIVTSQAATFWFEGEEVVRMSYVGANDFKLYPIAQIPEKTEQFLPGFKWEAERRPERSDVFTRTIKASRRSLYSTISKPIFPLTQRIDQHKVQLIGRREWEERYELLPQAAIEWLRKIGVRE
jgi:hypothetical protein